MTTPRRKLIEVALPLAVITDAPAHDKMPVHSAVGFIRHDWQEVTK